MLWLILSSDSKDIQNGFIPHDGVNKMVKCFKYVSRSEIEEIYDIKTTAKYKGYECMVLEETEDKILIIIDNILDNTSEELQMDSAIDKGMYKKWINKDEAEITVEKEML
ncbi:MAG: hypothetical protein WAX04_11835 [Oscillospiraceae bacterium]